MSGGSPRHLVVGRLRKPHGLKGDVAVFPLTDEPERVFAAGQPVWLMGLDGTPGPEPLVIARSRPHHREWLIAFRGIASRDAIEGWRDLLLAVPATAVAAPEGDEVYLHELVGFAVRSLDDRALGVVTALYELPGGLTLEVQGPKREFLLPYRKAFVREVDRSGRRLVVDLPEGLVDLESTATDRGGTGEEDAPGG